MVEAQPPGWFGWLCSCDNRLAKAVCHSLHLALHYPPGGALWLHQCRGRIRTSGRRGHSETWCIAEPQGSSSGIAHRLARALRCCADVHRILEPNGQYVFHNGGSYNGWLWWHEPKDWHGPNCDEFLGACGRAMYSSAGASLIWAILEQIGLWDSETRRMSRPSGCHIAIGCWSRYWSGKRPLESLESDLRSWMFHQMHRRSSEFRPFPWPPARRFEELLPKKSY